MREHGSSMSAADHGFERRGAGCRCLVPVLALPLGVGVLGRWPVAQGRRLAARPLHPGSRGLQETSLLESAWPRPGGSTHLGNGWTLSPPPLTSLSVSLPFKNETTEVTIMFVSSKHQVLVPGWSCACAAARWVTWPPPQEPGSSNVLPSRLLLSWDKPLCLTLPRCGEP